MSCILDFIRLLRMQLQQTIATISKCQLPAAVVRLRSETFADILYFFNFSGMGVDEWVLRICMCYVATLFNCVVCTLKCILGGQLIWFFIYSGSLEHDFTYCFTYLTFMCVVNFFLLFLLFPTEN